MRFKILFASLLCFCALNFVAQDLAETEKELSSLLEKLAFSRSDNFGDSISLKMRETFIASFSSPETFDHSFESLKMSKVISADNKVRLFNWNQPKEDGTYKYYCFVLKREKKGMPFEWFELEQSSKEQDKVENKILNSDKWIGALFYDIFPVSTDKKNNEYVVLGWEGKDELTTRKIIDVIVFSGNKVRLGAPIFKSELGTKKRVIFEYSNEVSMSVKYYPKKKCIVVDHLSPKNSMMEGIYADYGPDGSYDLYQLEKGKFEFYDNIDTNQFVEENEIPYYNPRPGRRR